MFIVLMILTVFIICIFLATLYLFDDYNAQCLIYQYYFHVNRLVSSAANLM